MLAKLRPGCSLGSRRSLSGLCERLGSTVARQTNPADELLARERKRMGEFQPDCSSSWVSEPGADADTRVPTEAELMSKASLGVSLGE